MSDQQLLDIDNARECLVDAIKALDVGNPYGAYISATAAKGFLGDFDEPAEPLEEK